MCNDTSRTCRVLSILTRTRQLWLRVQCEVQLEFITHTWRTGDRTVSLIGFIFLKHFIVYRTIRVSSLFRFDSRIDVKILIYFNVNESLCTIILKLFNEKKMFLCFKIRVERLETKFKLIMIITVIFQFVK